MIQLRVQRNAKTYMGLTQNEVNEEQMKTE